MQEVASYLSDVITSTDIYQEWKYNSWYKHYEAKFGPPNEENENLWMQHFYWRFY